MPPSSLKDGASIRDPAGYVFYEGGRVLRALSPSGAEILAEVRENGFYDRLVRDGLLIEGARVAWTGGTEGAVEVLEHPRLPLVCYPYEMPFAALKAAALHHLRLHRALLARNFDLIDASAYNIQFVQTGPVFIDPTSIVRWQDGPWRGYRQFCREFLYPLLVTAQGGMDFHPFYRGQLDGLDAGTVLRLLPLSRRLKPGIFLHVLLQSWAAARPEGGGKGKARPQTRKPVFDEILAGMERLIAGLDRPAAVPSTWGDYMRAPPYLEAQMEGKRKFVAQWVEAWKPGRLLDLGCNTGDFSLLALKAGAGFSIGVEFDATSADIAFKRAAAENANFLPLVIDLLDPSAARGWNGRERKSFAERCMPDMALALALIHHLAIKGIRIEEIVSWLVAQAPRGIVEFVPRGDPMVQRMLNDRGIDLPGFDIDAFANLLRRSAHIVGEHAVSPGGRTLFAYERT